MIAPGKEAGFWSIKYANACLRHALSYFPKTINTTFGSVDSSVVIERMRCKISALWRISWLCVGQWLDDYFGVGIVLAMYWERARKMGL